MTIDQSNPLGTALQTRDVIESSFVTHDGVELFYRYWPAETEKTTGATLLFHRGHEHSGRISHLVDELELPDHAFFAWDARGHGKSPGGRGYSPSFAASVRDVQTFVDHIRDNYGLSEEQLAVIAQSVGAVLISTWVHDYAPKIRAMVLASPAFKVKLYVPFARTGIKLLQAIKGNFFVNSYVKAQFLTHDPMRIASFNDDPLISRPISSNILLELYENAERIVADAAAISVPTQLFVSGADWVVHHKPQHTFYENLGSLVKERHILDGFYHDTLGEKNRHLAISKIREFIKQRFAAPLNRLSRIDADHHGFTRFEADKLATPAPIWSLKGAYWAIYRLGLTLGGTLSEGVKLGHETGFDSGSTLDYVYRNQPSGKSKLGELIDKNYLDAIGWKGIRQRKLNIEELLRLASDKLRAEGRAVNVMDIASGHGRYILEAIESEAAQSHHKPDAILLRDYSELNVEKGQQLIKEKGLQEVASFIKADAFNESSYKDLPFEPTLGVVSGLYELFADNKLVRTSLQGLATSIAEGGYLIYTGQPWHPQLEMIARALTSHREGEAWVMRRRVQEEMDQLVAEAGFTKITQRIDPYGIFTVSLAVKRTQVQGD